MPGFNIPAIMATVEAAERKALETTADFVSKDAKTRAPVRKVFKEARGFRRRFRPLTPAERNIATRRALAYSGYTDFQRRASVAYIQRYARVEIRRRGSANALARSRTLRFLGTERSLRLPSGGHARVFSPRVDAMRARGGFTSASLNPMLTARGRYEVRSGRAIHREPTRRGTAVRVQIGGKLKASIGPEDVRDTADGVAISVSARIRYAKFVEFPTTHNAAQPFLLPALHDARALLRNELASEVKRALGG